MQKRILARLGVLCLVVLGGCRCPYGLQDRYDPAALAIRSDQNDVFESAPIVVVARVESVSPVGSPTRAVRASNLLVQLTKVDIHIERALRGQVPGFDTHFFFFAYSQENHGYTGQPLYRVAAGERRIFFLTTEHGQLRSYGDVRDYTLHVPSGFHPDLSCSGRSYGETVSCHLLSVGEGYDSSMMIASLPIFCPVSDRLSSRVNTVHLLRQLTKSKDKSLSAAACLYMAKEYAGQYACLDSLVIGDGIDARVVVAAATLREEIRQRNKKLESKPGALALDMAANISVPPTLIAVTQELELYLDDPDVQVRVAACKVLSQSLSTSQPRCAALNHRR